MYTDSLNISEWHIYGSARMGIRKAGYNVAWRKIRIEGGVSTYEGSYANVAIPSTEFTQIRGSKRYELSNLPIAIGIGNVLTVISDKRLSVCSAGVVQYYTADVVSATDYSPFGAPLPSRTWQGEEYRYGFNGQEKDDEIAGAGSILTAEYWEYDSRLGRRWNVDPVIKEYESPYTTFSCSPILLNDPNGDDPPKRLSFIDRSKNFFSGRGYENRAIKYAVENNIDESKVKIDRNSGNVVIDKSRYVASKVGTTTDGLSIYKAVFIDEKVIFGKDPRKNEVLGSTIVLVGSPDPSLTKIAAIFTTIYLTYIIVCPPPPIVISHPVPIELPRSVYSKGEVRIFGMMSYLH